MVNVVVREGPRIGFGKFQMTRNGPRMVLLATGIGNIIVMLDTSIVNVALQGISQDLGSDITSLQWIVNAYVLLFASLLLLGGALGDALGSRRVYVTGLAVFTIASLASGFAPGTGALIAARALQGVGAAMLMPCSLALLTQTYSNSEERARAIATLSGWGGIALIVGPIAGGVLVTAFNWRSIFLVNVPIGLLGIWLTLRTALEPDPPGRQKIDYVGLLSLTVSVVLATAVLIEVSKLGWSNPWIVGASALALTSFGAFISVERHARSPILPLHLFANSTFSLIGYVFVAGAGAFFGMLFVLSLFFQKVEGYSPLEAGAALLPLSIGVVLGNSFSRRLVSRTDPLRLMLTGSGIRLLGFVALALSSTAASHPIVGAVLLVIGIGAGLGSPMSTAIFMSTVERTYTGIASGIARAAGQVGSALGVAIFGSLFSGTSGIRNLLSVSATWAAIVTVTILAVNVYLLLRTETAQTSEVSRAD
ncbi:major facilitator superfamily protein [Burkholderia pseudomallei]|uniref:MFS transporter n=1 Tax=Burkholderia pseudomallei TaxID=28450 RepID=UPI00053909FB|nr:MFS transporter [Burkholderia pseudomallei]KGV82451.1 major Facilitator Superfamily protein [Burkholderia pseudomallei MSHR4375]KGX66112.1 major Facilitator Superfamily protein [Burkholderia pseudomallei TSV5]KGX66383.1 major Facilitator Superfamily protein [Burkholderia pseudomallei TSV32]MBF3899479.1 MFS transporter [Burkholderia pseudomallei]MBO2978502.1 MFS transporter [Burkholderia pseudomallei]